MKNDMLLLSIQNLFGFSLPVWQQRTIRFVLEVLIFIRVLFPNPIYYCNNIVFLSHLKIHLYVMH